MRKYVTALVCLVSLSVCPGFAVPMSGTPVILRSGKYEVQISPAQAWTPYSISYNGTKVGLDNGYYGTVIRKDATTFTGSGHTEGGAELVTNLVVEVDGVSQGEPVPGATYSGSTVTLTKLSRVGECDERFVVKVTADGISEAVDLTAVETQTMIGMYAFMHPLFTNTTEWVAEDGSATYEGYCLSDGDWELREDIRWVALYSPDQQLGVHISYPVVYDGYDKKTGIWDLTKYHKVYFQPFGTATFEPGTKHSWEMEFKCFESAPASWKETARALNDSDDSAESLASIEAVDDRTVDTADSFESEQETLLIRGKAGATYSRKTWIRFDLKGRQYIADKPATFRVTYLPSTYSGKLFVFALNAGFSPSTGVLDAGWDEAGLSWDNAPANNTSHPYGFSSDATKVADLQLDSSGMVEGQILEFTVPKLADYLQADESVTFMLSSYDGGAGSVLNIASSEHPTYDGPVLAVTEPFRRLQLILIY